MSYIFRLFYIYSLVIYSKILKDESLEIAKNIRADEYIENFLKEFYEPLENTKSFIIYIVIFISFSALIQIIGWVIPPLIKYIIEKKQENKYYERRIPYEYQRNININQGGRIPYNSKNNNGQELNTNVNQINSNRGLNNEQLVTNDNKIENNNNNNENNATNNEKENQENKQNEKVENPITQSNDHIIN